MYLEGSLKTPGSTNNPSFHPHPFILQAMTWKLINILIKTLEESVKRLLR